MMLLKYDTSEAWFLKEGTFQKIDTISKNDIFNLIEKILTEEEIELQDYQEKTIQNVAHDIIYRNIYAKLLDVKSKKSELNDFFKTAYIEKFEKYTKEIDVNF